MPSALWTYYDRELRVAIRAADARRDVRRLTELLGESLCFERLVEHVSDRGRLDEVRRHNEAMRQRVLALTVALVRKPVRR